MGDALSADPRLWAVATLRSDFLTRLLEAGLSELVRGPTAIGPLGRAELYEVIGEARGTGRPAFDPGVVARMVDGCGGGGALPLLAYTLHEPYLRAGGRRRRHVRHHAHRHRDHPWRIDRSPDGRRLATGSHDRTVRLWDPDTAAQIAVVGVHADWAHGLSWHPDGTRIASASRDRTVRLRDLTDLDALLRRARSRVFRVPTAEERRAFLLPPAD